ncbi:hypothetical protein U27_05282 [Candidatus Vecturithrix granuli]|uniref:site-specific DNA-methyltransferase (adenine-specific) n=1 Tax=Vecturithrix granuli TaxID=1499967 RepID=A0A081C153_VECG1|nr:hypothetical protein U27_05282 [Candidatus Vecturithrix granuli]
MAIAKDVFAQFIKAFQFREVFNEMGWNNDRSKQTLVVDGARYTLTGVAEKRGFRIFTCTPADGAALPDRLTRKQIEGKVTKLFQEHLIIFIDAAQQEQIWQLAVRKAGSPTRISETRYSLAQDPQLLYQRASGLFFTLDEEEHVTIIDVTTRVAENFQQNNEKVTKKFYERFKKQHAAFLKFIQGIDDNMRRDWYASLMLNRLMFCYFIQKKGFLDNNTNYLQTKLRACQARKGQNAFYSFYRNFLLALFHQGLGAPQRDEQLEVELGQIPYLNGGLFDEHEIEKTFPKIQIADQAFEALFDFFDEYEWHLDTRAAASGRDINPDVIGYIFEKYINDRAQMGAYYTKEDITDYISKNCVIPWLFDEVKRQYPAAFAADGWLWFMFRHSGDEYLYDAVKYGIPEPSTLTPNPSPRGRGEVGETDLFADLPPEILQGFDPELEQKIVDGSGPWLWELRKSWNRSAPADIALPTETYRELIERRRRYAEITAKIANGEIHAINDFITYNLNIRQFAQDVIETTADAEFVKQFYKALNRITILDPTCGSGAFLFAALNILEPLYEACIHRMKNFIDEEEMNHRGPQIATDQKQGKTHYKFFEEVLRQVNAPEHPNLQYFIYKSIILNNLYGVDIMNEAVEIAKLRLFLKLAATVDADYRKPNLGLEPLPDVDFNIRAGNTLVGYATETQLNEAFVGRFDFDNDAGRIKEQCDIVARAFARYKEIQLAGRAEFADFKQAKDDLNRRLAHLTDKLNALLHKQHYAHIPYEHWQAAHQPLHWFAEFYEIIHARGGFDAIIGNPPYVEYSKTKKTYQLKANAYESESAGNLYALCFERSLAIQRIDGWIGMIVQQPIVSTQRMEVVRKILLQNSKIVLSSTFDDRPSKLFDGMHHARMAVLIAQKTHKQENINLVDLYVTRYNKWYKEESSIVFEILNYIKSEHHLKLNVFPKMGSVLENTMIAQLVSIPTFLAYWRTNREANYQIYYKITGVGHWFTITVRPPRFFREGIESSSTRENTITFTNQQIRDQAFTLMNSSLFYWFYQVRTNCRDFNPSDYKTFPIPDNLDSEDFSSLSQKLQESIDSSSTFINITHQKTGEIKLEQFRPREAKPIIDEIDTVLAQHYGFSQAELDFIINYDIKYRLGKELRSAEEEGA